jgi:hypothetical protein
MNRRIITSASLSGIILSSVLILGLAGQAKSFKATGSVSASQVPIYVSDFELPTLPPTAPSNPASGVAGKSPKPATRAADAPPLVYDDSDVASVRARKLIDFFSSTLIKTLQNNGYTAARLSGALPENGVLLQGVFSESGPQNRIRRALLGSVSPSPKFLLYVGTFNLARPDQPLYEMATDQPGEANYGPIITMNSYIPMTKYELDKNPSEDEVQKICAKVVASLTTLLNSNPDAFSQ